MNLILKFSLWTLLLAPMMSIQAEQSNISSEQDAVLKTRPMQLDDLFKIARVSSPDITQDASRIVYSQSQIDLKANSSSSQLMLVANAEDATPISLTNAGKLDSSPRFSPDGKRVLFESNRSGTSQLWCINLSGGEAYQLTALATEASGAIWSPDGLSIAFVSSVFPQFTVGNDKATAQQNADLLKQMEDSSSKVRTFDHLFYRHWDGYVEGKRQHLFVLKMKEQDGRLVADGLPHDATPGDRDAAVTSSTFSSGADYCFSDDGSHLIFTTPPSKSDVVSYEAWSTNYDIARVAIDNNSTKWEILTADNLAADSGPQVSPDGKTLAWRSQKIPGAEADRWLITTQRMKSDGTLTGSPMRHTLADDVSVDEFVWIGNNKLVFNAQWQARTRLYSLNLDSTNDAGKVVVQKSSAIHELRVAKNGTLVFTRSSLNAPADVYVMSVGQSETNLSNANKALLAEIKTTPPQWQMDVSIQGDRKLQMWIMTPPDFDKTEKYPCIYMIHGGPQGAWNDSWSYRWNPALWAAQGYVVVLPNPRGSTGFGQQFTDEISGDWGGKCYRDLMAGADAIEKLPYVDKDRIAAAGASFGGYMMNWFAVNTARFCTLVTHCSVFNFDSMWGSTDELWFDEYEHGGTPWDKAESYRKFSPAARAGEIGKNGTPMLVIHNDLDFRCPIGQGIELFTTLQRQNVKSRFVNFPDEGHWVNKPANSLRWHQEVFAWLETYCKNKPPAAR